MVITQVAVIQALGCVSPERRYRILSAVFDGVPKPGSLEVEQQPSESVGEDEPEPVASEPAEQTSSTHGPFAQKNCTLCHDSRQSNRLNTPADELCWDCHDEGDFSGEVVHMPVAAGMCTECHSPHRSPNPHLLLHAGASLCEQCHDRSTFANTAQHSDEEGEDCVACHDPHAAEGEYLLRGAGGPS